ASCFFSSRRRHTRSYGDWSSDVCSSDLRYTYFIILCQLYIESGFLKKAILLKYVPPTFPNDLRQTGLASSEGQVSSKFALFLKEIGRASCRERVYIAEFDVS